MSTIQDSLTRQQFSVLLLNKFTNGLQLRCLPTASLSSQVSELESSTGHCSHSTVASV